MPRELKWTPGPWRVAENEWNAKRHEPWTDAIKIEGDVDGPWAVPPLVCATYRGDGNEANARLIAAAPELYEVLEKLISGADNVALAFPSGENAAAFRSLVDDARVVLTKARGDAA